MKKQHFSTPTIKKPAHALITHKVAPTALEKLVIPKVKLSDLSVLREGRG